MGRQAVSGRHSSVCLPPGPPGGGLCNSHRAKHHSGDLAEIVFPAYFDREEPILRSTGSFADLTVVGAARRYRPVIYDWVRLDQEVRDGIATRGVFAEPTRSWFLRSLEPASEQDDSVGVHF
jgi:hypothetical protein